MNTRQQTERDLKKEKRKHGTIEQMCQVSLSLSLCGSLNNNLVQYLYFLFVYIPIDSWENEFFLLFLGDQTEP